MLVLKPNFSALAISASAAEVSLHCDRNFLIESFSLAKSVAIWWFGDMAINETPKIVSGLVVNAVK